MKILVFSSLFPHAGEPTLGVFVENRLRHLVADTGIEAAVIAPVPWFPFRHPMFGRYSRAAMAPAQEVRHGITVYHPRFLVIPKIGMRWTPGFLYRAARRLMGRLMVEGHKFDLVDAHYLYPDGVAAARLAGDFDLPFLMTARGSDVTQIALMPGPGQQVMAAVAKASHIITVSESLRRDLIALGADADKVTTLRNGVDCVRFHEVARAETRATWGFKGPIILFAGWLVDRKRVDIVVDATARIPGACAVIVGDGPLRQVLEARARDAGLEGRVLFLGQKKPEEMPALMSAADILMLPSEREGWPNVLLEAMACGTPVVARAIGGAPDFVTVPEAGRLVPEGGHAADFAAATEALLADYPDRQAVRAYAEGFGWAETSAGQMRLMTAAIKAH